MQLLLILLSLATVFAGLYVLRRQSLVNPLAIALVVTGAMGVYFPLGSMIVEPITWRNIYDIPHGVFLSTQADYLCFALGLSLAAIFAVNTGLLPSSASRVSGVGIMSRDTMVTLGLLTVGTALYVKFVMLVGFVALTNHENYAEKHLASQGMGPLKLGLEWMIVACLWAEAGLVKKWLKHLCRAIAVGIVCWSVGFISSRSYVLMLFVGYAVIICQRGGYRLKSIKPSLIAGVLFAYLSLEFFVLYRGAYSGGFFATLQTLADFGVWQDHIGVVVGGSEFSHPFITCMEIEFLEDPGGLAGQSYLETPLVCVPLSFFPNRPMTLAEAFVSDQYANLSDRGGGTAFSLVAEAWWNLGAFWGPLAVGAVSGWCLVLAERQRLRRPHGLVARLLPALALLLITAHRNTLAIVFKHSLMISLPAVGLFVAISILLSTARTTPSRPLPGRLTGLQPALARPVNNRAVSQER